MKTRTAILSGAAIKALIAATALTSVANVASIPSSPAERAATAELNRNITLGNAVADNQYRLLMVQHQEQMKQQKRSSFNINSSCRAISKTPIAERPCPGAGRQYGLAQAPSRTTAANE